MPPAPSTSAAPEIPRLKLKPLAAQESSAAAPIPAPIQVTPPPIATGAAPFPPIPAFPVVQALPPMPVTEPSVPEPLIGGLPPVVVDTGGLSMPPPRAMPPPLAPPPPPVAVPSPYKAKPKPKRQPVTLILIAIVVVILLIGAGGYFFFFKDDSVAAAPPPVVAKPVVPVAEIPKPPTVPIAPLPPPPAPLQSIASTPSPNATPAVPVATPAFRSWVSNVRISGVRSGESPMAIVNGRLARPGDMVDAAEGVVFEGVDGEQKLLSFRGRNSAVLTKPY